MKNFVQPGNTITVTAPAGGVTSGAGVQVGALFGVAAFDAAAGAPVEVTVEGVFELAKLDTDVVAVGDRLYWDAANTRLTVTQGTGDLQAGLATTAAGNGAAVVQAKLTPGAV